MASGALTEQVPQIKVSGGNSNHDPLSTASISANLASSRDGKLKSRPSTEGWNHYAKRILPMAQSLSLRLTLLFPDYRSIDNKWQKPSP